MFKDKEKRPPAKDSSKKYYCGECGSEVKDGHHVCGTCNNKIDWDKVKIEIRTF